MLRRQNLGRTLIVLVAVAVSVSGCEPLRKKFTRKKKQEVKQEFLPVLDPIDYPPSRVSSIDKYKYHYSMWQVWSKDLMQLLGEPTLDKRKNYLLTEITQQLEELKRWIPEEQLPKVDEALAAYERIAREMSKPEMMRDRAVMETRMRRAESFVKNELDPDIVFPQEGQ